MKRRYLPEQSWLAGLVPSEPPSSSHRVWGLCRDAAVAATAFLVFPLIGGDAPPSTPHTPSLAAPESQPGRISYQEAIGYAEAIAHRFDACKIVDQPTKGKPYKESWPPYAERSRIMFTVETKRNVVGQAAEDRFRNNNQIVQDTRIAAYIIKQTEQGPELDNFVKNDGPLGLPSKVDEPRSKVALYPKTALKPGADPRTGHTEGTQMAVFVKTAAETWDTSQQHGRGISVSTFCGVLMMAEGVDGQVGWQTVTTPLTFPTTVDSKDCQLVPNPANPGTYTPRCQ